MGIFVRYLESVQLQTMDIVAVRVITTTIILFFFLLIYDRKRLFIKWNDLWCFLGTGLMSILFFNYCYFKAMSLISLSMAAVLLYTAPAFVILFSHLLFGEKLGVRKIMALFLTFAGCVMVTGIIDHPGETSKEGILLGLGAGIGYAMYTKGMSMMESGRAAIIASVEPVVATIIGMLLYQEKLTRGEGIGILLVLAAIMLCSTE